MTRNQFIMAVGFACGIFLAFPRLGVSQEPETPPAQNPPAADFSARIISYQSSYLGWVFNDEPHATFQISIQYPFLPFEAFGANTASAFIGSRSGLYVAYTGRSDIYFDRHSAPTISREHNPGFYFDFDRCFDQPWRLNLGYFHDSNGQVVDTRAAYLAIAEHAQDFVSRGWDYLLLSTAYTFSWQDRSNQETSIQFTPDGILNLLITADPKVDKSKLTLGVQGLYFLDKQGFGAAPKEEDIFWEDVSIQPRRSDFDGIRVSMVLKNPYYLLADTLRTGYSAFQLTNDLSLTFRIGKWLPLTIQYHNGYGPDLSVYHIYSQRLTLGCELYGMDE
jgi:hypothetical protein